MIDLFRNGLEKILEWVAIILMVVVKSSEQKATTLVFIVFPSCRL